MNYVILSLKHTRKGHALLLWWRPDAVGYTTNFDKAGRYSPAEVAARPNYYDNKVSTIAIPVDVAMRFVRSVVEVDNIREMLDRPVWVDDDGLHLEQPEKKPKKRKEKTS